MNPMLFTEYGPKGATCVIPDSEYLKFQVVEGVPLETFKAGFDESGYYAILFIPANILASESATDLLHQTDFPGGERAYQAIHGERDRTSETGRQRYSGH